MISIGVVVSRMIIFNSLKQNMFNYLIKKVIKNTAFLYLVETTAHTKLHDYSYPAGQFFPYLHFLTFLDGVGWAEPLYCAEVQTVQLLACLSITSICCDATLDQSHRQLTQTLDTDTVCWNPAAITIGTSNQNKEKDWLCDSVTAMQNKLLFKFYTFIFCNVFE